MTKKNQKAAEELCRTSCQKHFTKQQLEKLICCYEKLTEGNRMDRNLFRQILHMKFNMTDDLLMDRVFKEFDKDSDSFISINEWVEGLSVFLRGEMAERIEYMFHVYDLNSDGYISREEMFQMLKTALVRNIAEEDPDEGVKDLVELSLKKLDYDHDSRVSLMDFQTAIKEDPLLLEIFGCCLPDQKCVDAFEVAIGLHTKD